MSKTPHEPAELVQTMVDEITVALQKLAAEYELAGKSDHVIDQCRKWAYAVSCQLPMCCAGHRIDRLSSIQQELFGCVKDCSQFQCPDEELHQFMVELVKIIGDAGQRLLVNRMLKERVN